MMSLTRMHVEALLWAKRLPYADGGQAGRAAIVAALPQILPPEPPPEWHPLYFREIL